MEKEWPLKKMYLFGRQKDPGGRGEGEEERREREKRLGLVWLKADCWGFRSPA